MKTCIISVYIKTRHYLQLKTFFHRNVETDILCGRTVFSHYPRLYLKSNPRRLCSIPAYNMPKQTNPRAAWLNAPIIGKPSIAYKISSIFARNRASLRTIFIFPQRRVRLTMVYMPVHLFGRRFKLVICCMVSAILRIHRQPLVFRHKASIVIYHFMY